ncbi:MAG: hypothetical protein RIC16_15655 [Rhodospirillales bacterium]
MFSLRLVAAVVLILAALVRPDAALAQDADAQAFVSGIEDLPLMPGLTETAEGSLVFESAGGRFVEVYAVGDVSRSDVEGFYGESLPQLGWQKNGPTNFRRDNEVLVLEFISGQETAAPLTVRFALSPADG